MADSEKLSTDPYKGVRDFYPADWARMRAMFSCIRETLNRYGYEEYNASPLERAELYEAKTSEEIVNEQTYTFTDRGDRRVTLRPEMTPTLARMLAAKRREFPLPIRWFSIGNRFRYERPQRGRLREFYQVDVDLLGAVNVPHTDVEIISIASAILKSFGATEDDFTIRVSSRALLNAACAAAGLSEDATRSYLRLLDRKAKMPADEFATEVHNLTNIDPLALIEDGTAPEVNSEKQALKTLLDVLSKRGVGNAQFDPEITRGFLYYTGMVFEVYDTNPENTRALFGGGRYDKLLSLFGGDQIPAVGFGMGDVTLADFLETHGLASKVSSAPILFLGTVLPYDQCAVEIEAVADKIRVQGISVFTNIVNKHIGDQVKEANRRGIPYFAAVGSDEIDSGTLRVKRLATGEERALVLSDVSTFCIH
ncbi:MAG: histidine--tRNA ligase [Parcubacteria group bacterium 21-54-25]|nr:MAG: histidine--tRNA ligase [Parcubacteria group bacterium 21-54-25]HQU07630.1 histidine--tRNA ligase [Candidatus Paceibacterota bacterium]